MHVYYIYVCIYFHYACTNRRPLMAAVYLYIHLYNIYIYVNTLRVQIYDIIILARSVCIIPIYYTNINDNSHNVAGKHCAVRELREDALARCLKYDKCAVRKSAISLRVE